MNGGRCCWILIIFFLTFMIFLRTDFNMQIYEWLEYNYCRIWFNDISLVFGIWTCRFFIFCRYYGNSADFWFIVCCRFSGECQWSDFAIKLCSILVYYCINVSGSYFSYLFLQICTAIFLSFFKCGRACIAEFSSLQVMAFVLSFFCYIITFLILDFPELNKDKDCFALLLVFI